MSETAEELRIIARDGGRLNSADMAMIANAADELERAEHMLVATQAALIESCQRRIAMHEALVEMLGKAAVPAPNMISFRIPDCWRVVWRYNNG